MTLTMADSITPANLPDGFNAYLGYIDGSWPDFQAEVKRFPGKHIIGIAVTAADDGEGLDVEFRDATPDQAPGWVRRQHARGVEKPIIYASISVMKAVVFLLTVNGIARSSVRLLSAHYGWDHICGPHTCAYFGSGTPQCDGTQWTDAARGLNGSQIDVSALEDSFFGTTKPAPTPAPAPSPTPTPAPTGVPTWQEDALKALPVVKDGDTGNDVRTVQGLCEARGFSVGPTGIDGKFGTATKDAVVAAQKAAGFDAAEQDGEVGPKTWPALLGVS